MKAVERIREWYRGTYVPPPPNDPSSQLVFISPGHYEQSALAKGLRALGRFWLCHWKWIITTALAASSIFLVLAHGAAIAQGDGTNLEEAAPYSAILLAEQKIGSPRMDET
jgi:hypothetical protein